MHSMQRGANGRLPMIYIMLWGSSEGERLLRRPQANAPRVSTMFRPIVDWAKPSEIGRFPTGAGAFQCPGMKWALGLVEELLEG